MIFAGQSLEQIETHGGCSLSQRERVRVRESLTAFIAGRRSFVRLAKN
jgi:hypothetical protein